MGFLAPWFVAAGVAAAALPVWLHLLRKHRSNPTPFSSLMFFERRTQSSIKHRRLQYLLLFALRTLLIAAIALAFAKPYLNSHVLGPAGGALKVIAIDESFSMRQGDRMERARREATSLLKSGARYQVIGFAAQSHVLTDGSADVNAARSAIASIEPSDSLGSYAELVRTLRLISGSAKVPLEVHLFSDLQKTSLPAGFSDLRLPSGTSLVVHPAGGQLANWTVESVVAPRRVYDATKARVRAAIAGFASEPARRRVSLVLNGRALETKEVEIAASGRAFVEFAIPEVPHGLNRGEIRLEPADAFPQDDRLYFAMEHGDSRPALFVHEGRGSRGALYFRAALESSSNPAFHLQEARPAELVSADLSRYALIVLSDAAPVPASFEENLKKYVAAGGAVWVALGPTSAASGQVPLLGAQVAEGRNYARGPERFQPVSWSDSAHPSLARTGKLDGVRFFYAVRIDVPSARVAARLADDTPLLFETTLGQGKVLVFASSFDNIANDLPLRACFVPFVEQTTHYLGGASDGAPYITVDSHVELRAARDRAASVEVIDPGGQRALSLQEAAKAATVVTDREGFYEVRRGNGRNELIAVNADRRESDFEPIGADMLALWQKSGASAAATSTAAAGGRIENSRVSFWWYVLALALALAVAESWVGNRYLAEKPQSERNTEYKEMAA